MSDDHPYNAEYLPLLGPTQMIAMSRQIFRFCTRLAVTLLCGAGVEFSRAGPSACTWPAPTAPVRLAVRSAGIRRLRWPRQRRGDSWRPPRWQCPRHLPKPRLARARARRRAGRGRVGARARHRCLAHARLPGPPLSRSVAQRRRPARDRPDRHGGAPGAAVASLRLPGAETELCQRSWAVFR